MTRRIAPTAPWSVAFEAVAATIVAAPRRLAAVAGPWALLVAISAGCAGEDVVVGAEVRADSQGADGGDGGCQGPGCAACQGQADGAPCDDGEPCTAADACQAGSCRGALVCDCLVDADCASKPGLDLCLGTPRCDRSGDKPRCDVVPSSAVSCEDLGELCRSNTCDPATGGCVVSPVAAGAACDDGSACTVNDGCDGAGSCAGSALGADGAPICACNDDAGCAALQPSDLCAARLYCDLASHACQPNPATAIVCPPSGAPCLLSACQPANGACTLAKRPDASPCDDAEPCTTGDACQGGACVAGTWTCPCGTDADCGVKEDGDICNGMLYCDKAAGACKVNPATVVVCPTGGDTACVAASCVKATGACVPLPINASGSCDDGDPCTLGESCQAGNCAQGQPSCPCGADADCAAKEDGDLCNGTLFCDSKVGQCKVNPATVVSCPDPPDPGCATIACQPKSGLCLTSQALKGKPCNDGSPCTVGDACSEGSCVSGSALVCPCTDDAGCAKFEDGDLCNGTLYCDKGTATGPACKINPATVIACPLPPAGGCIAVACQPGSGACTQGPLADGAACDDGDPCAGPDSCAGGTCSGAKIACDDGQPCTIDACDPLVGGCDAKPKACGDGNPCTVDACDAATGACSHAAVAAASAVPCDDGNACTALDACKGPSCQGKATGADGAPVCGDGDACTADLCDAATGACSFVKLTASATLTAACDDGDACTAGDACAAGACQGKGLAAGACADGSACTFDTCHKLVGCLHLPTLGVACDDGDPCTAGDACAAAGCVGALPGSATATAAACSDGNPCTTDSCKSGQGCTHVAHGGACDDGDPCTGDDACAAGSCAGQALGCACATDADCAALDDANLCNGKLRCDTTKPPYACVPDPSTVVVCPKVDGACASASCQPASGTCATTTLADGSACAPGGDPCKAGACAAGSCVAKGATSCDDGNACTLDVCAPAAGCLHQGAALDGKPCDDGDACSGGDACAAGTCAAKGATSCEDGNACSYEVCKAGKGCEQLPGALDDKPCEDGDGCTLGEACQADACKGAVPKVCDDGNPCTTDACKAAIVEGKPSGSCVATAVVGAAPCDDGDLCTDADACALGSCKGKAIGCGDGNPCTVDVCLPGAGCQHDPKPLAGALCKHAKACVVGAVCKDGLCSGGDASACGNTGDCSVQKNALFVAYGPVVPSARLAPDPQGGAWIGGAVSNPSYWLVSRLDAFGVQQLLWTIPLSPPTASAPTVLALPDGSVIVAGGTNPVDGLAWQQWKSEVRRYDAAGKLLWANTPGSYQGGAAATGLLRKDGSVVLSLGQTPNIETNFVALQPGGAKLWSVTRKGGSGAYYQNGWAVTDVIEAADGALVAAGSLRNPSTNGSTGGHLMMTRMSSTGAQIWVRHYNIGFDGYITNVVERAGGELVGVGYGRAKADGHEQPWLLRLDAKNNLLQSTAVATTPTSHILSGVALAGPDLILSGYIYRAAPATGASGFLAQRRPDGGFSWQRSFDLKVSTVLGRVAPVGDGYFVTGLSYAQTVQGLAPTTTLLRTDAWGHAPCSAAGVCLGKTPASCDDGVACTADVCDAVKGCVHAAIAGCKP